MPDLDKMAKARAAKKAGPVKRRKRPTRPIPARFHSNYKDSIKKVDLPLVEGALKGVASLKRAISAKCLDCCCWQKTEVAKCTAVCCPLWMYRPWKHKDQRVDEAGEVILEGAMVE